MTFLAFSQFFQISLLFSVSSGSTVKPLGVLFSTFPDFSQFVFFFYIFWDFSIFLKFFQLFFNITFLSVFISSTVKPSAAHQEYFQRRGLPHFWNKSRKQRAFTTFVFPPNANRFYFSWWKSQFCTTSSVGGKCMYTLFKDLTLEFTLVEWALFYLNEMAQFYTIYGRIQFFNKWKLSTFY